MQELSIEVLRFGVKATFVAILVLIVVAGVAGIVRRGKVSEARLVVRRLNTRFAELANAVRRPVLGPKRYKRHAKAEAKRLKERHAKRRIFVLEFAGDLAASAVSSLRHEISAVLGAAEAGDEVVLRLESSGGLVQAYGLAASQVARLKEKKLRLVVCVDKIAASGGYMMACLADELVAAPFAVIGSIGVVASVPNVHRLLEKHGVDYTEMTAGEFKRTVSFLGEISPEGKKKFQEQLEETHGLFKDFVRQQRPGLDIQKVATGEYWFGVRAKELNLVDRLQTSDDYLISQLETADVFQVSYRPQWPWRRRALGAVSETIEAALLRLWTGLDRTRFG